MTENKPKLKNEWTYKNIDELAYFERGKEPGSASYNRQGEGLRFIRVVDLSGSRNNVLYTNKQIKELKSCSEKDILISLDGSPGLIKRGLTGAYSAGIRKVTLKTKELDYDFLYFVLKSDIVQEKIQEYSEGVTIKHASQALKHIKIPVPPIPEQNKIVYILSKIEEAITIQKKMVNISKQLKTSTMHKLFMGGIWHKEFKETEIGRIPQNWGVEKLIKLTEKTEQKDMRKENVEFKYIDVSGVNNKSFAITSYSLHKGKNAPSRARKIVRLNDTIIATVRPTLKHIALIKKEYDNQICSTAFCVLRPINGCLIPAFLYYSIQQDVFINKLAGLQKGASYPAVTDLQIKNQKIGIPQIQEQQHISNILSLIDSKLWIEESRKEILKKLFFTVLNKLMLGEIMTNKSEF